MFNESKLYYKITAKEKSFYQITNINGKWIQRHGMVGAYGQSEPISDLNSVEEMLLKEKYIFECEWKIDNTTNKYNELRIAIVDGIKSEIGLKKVNALAIITDSDVISFAIAIKYFKDIDNTDDEKLWIVDEWGGWSNNWRCDIAYRWILLFDELGNNSSAHKKLIIKEFNAALKVFADRFDILLIYVGGDPCGHIWSKGCMKKKYSDRMLQWI